MKDKQTRQPVAGTVQANGWSLPQKGTGILFAGMMRSLYSQAIIPNDVGGLDISRLTNTVTEILSQVQDQDISGQPDGTFPTTNLEAVSKQVKKNSKARKKEKRHRHYSTQGIGNKKNCLLDIFEELKPKIALFTETQLSASAGCKIENMVNILQSTKRKGWWGIIFIDNEI